MANQSQAKSKKDTVEQPAETAAAEAATSTEAADVGIAGGAEGSAENVRLSGRSVFSIETTPAGVVVRTAFLTDDKRLLEMPMVFPDILYAFEVIDDLKRQVAQHFSNAARIGGQVIANQAAANQAAAKAADGSDAGDKAEAATSN